jgi:hypothetical protein
MFCMITNIYKKKTKGPTLMGLFTATGKLKKFFLTTRDVRCVHNGWHGTHQYDIQVLATRVNMGASIFFTAAVIRAFRSGNGGTYCVRPTIATWPCCIIGTTNEITHCKYTHCKCTHRTSLVATLTRCRISTLVGMGCRKILTSIRIFRFHFSAKN